MTYNKWLWEEMFFIAYHLRQPINVIKLTLSPIERRFFIDQFVEQREKEHKELNKNN